MQIKHELYYLYFSLLPFTNILFFMEDLLNKFLLFIFTKVHIKVVFRQIFDEKIWKHWTVHFMLHDIFLLMQ